MKIEEVWRHLAAGPIGPQVLSLAILWLILPVVHARNTLHDAFAAGPYARLVILNALVIPGEGSPPLGPWDIVIEGDTIRSITPSGASKPAGDRVIDASGKFLMPGLIDLHMHVLEEPLPLQYIYDLKLASGVTTLGQHPDRGLEAALEQSQLIEEYKILAPRLFPYWPWEAIPGYTRAELEDPRQAPRIAKAIAAKGMRIVSMDGWLWPDNGLSNPELFEAVCRAVHAAGGVTTVHLQPTTMSIMNAVDAAQRGVTLIEHHYGYAEAALARPVQAYPPRYQYNNELDRFRQAGGVWLEAEPEKLLGEVVEKLVATGVTMVPTRVVYEANRDVLRQASLPWHAKYTHQYILDISEPGAGHAAYHADWTSNDEGSWSAAFALWGRLIYAFNARGGRVAYGTDDPYMWNTPGFSNIRELQLNREAGVHALEALKFATYNSAQALREPHLGLVRTGFRADLLIVDGNPAYNLKFLYPTGDLTVDRDGQVRRTQGIVHTIKGGVVIENERVMRRIEQLVAASKRDAKPGLLTAPFATPAR